MKKRIYNKIINRIGEIGCYYEGYGYYKPINEGVMRMINRYDKCLKKSRARDASLKQFYSYYDRKDLPF